jgi:hypothetical protein
MCFLCVKYPCFGQVTFDAQRGPLQSVVGTMGSAWSSVQAGMAAANQSARAMADAEIEAHRSSSSSYGSSGGGGPRIGFNAVVEGVLAAGQAANQQVRDTDQPNPVQIDCSTQHRMGMVFPFLFPSNDFFCCFLEAVPATFELFS